MLFPGWINERLFSASIDPFRSHNILITHSPPNHSCEGYTPSGTSGNIAHCGTSGMGRSLPENRAQLAIILHHVHKPIDCKLFLHLIVACQCFVTNCKYNWCSRCFLWPNSHKAIPFRQHDGHFAPTKVDVHVALPLGSPWASPTDRPAVPGSSSVLIADHHWYFSGRVPC